jgi:hypothetical protein
MDVTGVIKISTTTLDSYCRTNDPAFDFLKIDVQGGELPVLQGAIKQLRNSILAVVLEVEFCQLYENQPLFPDVDEFMRGKGFALFDLDIRRWRRKKLPDQFNGFRMGQAIYADALYLWDPLSKDNRKGALDSKIPKLMKLAALAECFSLPDYSIEILSVAEESGLIGRKKRDELIGLLKGNRIIARYDRNMSQGSRLIKRPEKE